jgi:hypothetical protein
VYASLYASRLTSALPGGLPGTLARTTHASIGAALAAADKLTAAGHPALGSAIHNAASAAFFHGFHAGDFVSAGVAAAGALMALALLPSHPAVRSDAPAELGAPAPAPATN